jgi:hypothetical protein
VVVEPYHELVQLFGLGRRTGGREGAVDELSRAVAAHWDHVGERQRPTPLLGEELAWASPSRNAATSGSD